MRDWGPTVTCALLILGMAWGGYQIAASAWDSVVHYRTPYRFHPPLPAAEPLVPRVILVTIDGLRLDTSRQMDFLNELRRRRRLRQRPGKCAVVLLSGAGGAGHRRPRPRCTASPPTSRRSRWKPTRCFPSPGLPGSALQRLAPSFGFGGLVFIWMHCCRRPRSRNLPRQRNCLTGRSAVVRKGWSLFVIRSSISWPLI